MKKIFIIAVMALGLSSCTMQEDNYSNQQIFYGDKLIKARGLRDSEKEENGFIYNHDKDYDECKDCQNLY